MFAGRQWFFRLAKNCQNMLQTEVEFAQQERKDQHSVLRTQSNQEEIQNQEKSNIECRKELQKQGKRQRKRQRRVNCRTHSKIWRTRVLRLLQNPLSLNMMDKSGWHIQAEKSDAVAYKDGAKQNWRSYWPRARSKVRLSTRSKSQQDKQKIHPTAWYQILAGILSQKERKV